MENIGHSAKDFSGDGEYPHYTPFVLSAITFVAFE